MIRLLRPVALPVLLAMVLQMASAVLVLAPLLGMSELARQLLSPTPEPDAMWRLVWLSALGLGLGLGLRGAAELITHLADHALSLRLRLAASDRIAHAPLGTITAMGSGHIKQAMQDDVAALHHLVAHSGLDLAGAAATLVAIIIILWGMDPVMTSTLLLPLALYLLLYQRVLAACDAPRIAAYGVALGRVNQAVQEFITGMPTVRMFGTGDQAHQAYGKAIAAFETFYLAWVNPLLRPESLAGLAIAPITLLTLMAGAGLLRVQTGGMDALDLLPFVLLAPALSSPFSRLIRGAQGLQASHGALERLSTVLALPQAAPPTQPQAPAGSSVRFEQVCFAYADEQEANGDPVRSRGTLHDISFEMTPGTVTALVGASGSGKSTLARMLLRFHTPQSGCIRIGGVALEQIPEDALYRHVGFVFQDTRLLRASVRENIALGQPDASMDVVEAAARMASIHQRIMELPRGYDSICGEDARFSGGETQRIGIARALLHAPPILVLDEPTAHADPQTEADIQKALSALLARARAFSPQAETCSDGERTVPGIAATQDGGSFPHPREAHDLSHNQSILVIAHDLTTITQANQILVLEAGRIKERGTHAGLLAEGGTYARLWNARQSASSPLESAQVKP